MKRACFFYLVNPNRAKYFRLDYCFDKKRKTLAVGVYPEVTSKVARQKRDKARSQIANGIDPSLKRKVVLQ